ncbi:mismatch repair endonuclease PMS2-like [Ylistrum balloti]|uniref:mismatch repair endonuclease PMS2-like n=1 Tax=Ylistrum balloti TaxID=509963 RepID=UPI002905CA39|nr:mismatch repair endonuclease PMS2-like [Ylistrum balloti]
MNRMEETVCVEDELPQAGSIKAIDKRSVHRICSGQVVLTLATAVKELIENSIDAGATSVEVKLRDHGIKVVEVIDNGSGVEEKNFEGLTLKHHTSKLQDFSDLVGVETFGFRGEALSSLCALSNLTVVTRHSSSDVGTRLEFDHNGKITQRTAQARQVGTTVTLQNVFSTLPVRHKEFQRNIKKEFTKMVNVVNSYCIISTNVRITCSNQNDKGQRSVMVSSKGNSTLRDNISNVFGPKQTNNLLEIKQLGPSEEVCSEYGMASSNVDVPFRLDGFISPCVHGHGRSSADRQYFFINKRPCDSAKLSKVVNEVYHQFNRHQYPFVTLHVTMAKDAVDVNVTPDKRQIFMQDEKLLLATIKTSLLGLYQPTIGILQIKPVSTSSIGGNSTKDWETRKQVNRVPEDPVPSLNTTISSLSKLKRSYASVFSACEDASKKEQKSKQRKLDTFVTKKTVSLSDCEPDLDPTKTMAPSEEVVVLSVEMMSKPVSPTRCESGISSPKDTMIVGSLSQSSKETMTKRAEVQQDTVMLGSPGQRAKFQQDSVTLSSQGQSSQDTFLLNSQDSLTSGFDSQETVNSSNSNKLNSPLSKCEQLPSVSKDLGDDVTTSPTSHDESSPKDGICSSDNNLNKSEFSFSDKSRHDDEAKLLFKSVSKLSNFKAEKSQFLLKNSVSKSQGYTKSCSSDDCHFPSSSSINEGLMSDITNREDLNPSDGENEERIQEKDECEVTTESEEPKVKSEKITQFSMLSLKTKASARKKMTGKKNSEEQEFYRTFRASIVPTDNKSAEEELQREITKDTFEKMEILGQFNLGFIIAKNGDDLFIIDQHATDEKYNFEQLQKHTVLQSQRLIQPMNLELTASNETVLIDNLDIFRQNGFEFLIDAQAPPTQRVKLTSTPLSKNWNFGKEDVEEMIFMLSDSPGVMCRPSRVRQMFASRSCRKSIMIGTALNQVEMKKLVTHMGQIDQPWNCPHGRPTMRHLINLNMVPR